MVERLMVQLVIQETLCLLVAVRGKLLYRRVEDVLYLPGFEVV